MKNFNLISIRTTGLSLVLILMFSLSSSVLLAQTFTEFTGLSADRSIYEDGSFYKASITDAEDMMGTITTADNPVSFIVPFELPTVVTGEIVNDAKFKFSFYGNKSVAKVRLEVLSMKSSSVVEGGFVSETSAEVISDVFIDLKTAGAGTIGEPITIETDDMKLTSFINNAITDIDNKFIFFRLTPYKVDEDWKSWEYLRVKTSDSDTPPVLSLAIGLPLEETAPVIDPVDDILAYTGMQGGVRVTANDVNKGDIITFSLKDNALDYVSIIDNGDGTANVVVSDQTVTSDEGEHTITVVATDNSGAGDGGANLSSELSFKLTIEEAIITEIQQNGITWRILGDVKHGTYVKGDNWVEGPITILEILPKSEKVTMHMKPYDTAPYDQTYDQVATASDATYSFERVINGTMINPTPDTKCMIGYDSETVRWNMVEGNHPVNGKQGRNRTYAQNIHTYDEALNAARIDVDGVYEAISSAHPREVAVNSSIVSTISLDIPSRPFMKTNATLTVVEQAEATKLQAAEGEYFRPGYVGDNAKVSEYKISDLDLSVLGNLSRTDSMLPYNRVEDLFGLQRLDYQAEWNGEFILSYENTKGGTYGADLAATIGLGALALNTDYSDEGITLEDKRSLLASMVQYGIDLYTAVTDPNDGDILFRSNGGLRTGRKLPILMAGKVLGNNDMLNIATDHPEILFSEDQQTFYVQQSDIDDTNKEATGWVAYPRNEFTHPGETNWTYDTRDDRYYWYPKGQALGDVSSDLSFDDFKKGGSETGISDDVYNNLGLSWVQADLGMPEWGIRHGVVAAGITYTHASHKFWETSYRRCCNHSSLQGQILAVYAMGLVEVWNHPAIFDYMDRMVSNELQLTKENEIDFDDAKYGRWHPNLKGQKPALMGRGIIPGATGTQFYYTYGAHTMYKRHRASFGPEWIRFDETDIYSNGERRDPNLSISENEKIELSLVPNPVANGSFRVESVKGDYSIVIYDINGRVVYSNNRLNKSSVISTEKLKSGVYIVKVKQDNSKEFSSKLVVK